LKNLLVLGAGKSATVLIDDLNKTCAEKNWSLVVADADLNTAQSKITDASVAKAIELDITNTDARRMLITDADVVISLLPPHLHIHVAMDCAAIGRHLLTASYVDDSIRNLEAEIKSKELLFLCEMGLDPGIDHMSAMQLIDRIKEAGGQITSFKSHCGGLVAPESDNNPWHYKISWNPRNVVRAGSAGALYKENEEIVSRTYQQIFENTPSLTVEGLPALAWYPNRDSLSYIPLYKLEETATFIRTTLRYADFCKGWDLMVDLNLTADDDASFVDRCTTYHDWLSKKLKQVEGRELSLRMYLELYIPEADHDLLLEQFNFLELDASKPLPPGKSTSADLLQYQLEQKLVLGPEDRDMIVMMHEIDYSINKHPHHINSTLVVKGVDSWHTAMAKTVGLPLSIAAKLILENKIQVRGLHIPTGKEIYEPVLKELEEKGVKFTEREMKL